MAEGQPMMPLTDAAYGEQKTFREQQSSAPMAQAPGVPAGMPAVAPGAGAVPLTADSQFPDEPVTAGNPLGPGPGAAPAPTAVSESNKLLRYLPQIQAAADQEDAGEQIRVLARYLRGLQGG